MINELYQLILHPFTYIRSNADKTPKKMAILCIVLASLSIASEANGKVLSLIPLSILTVIAYSNLLFIQSVTIDFFAQWSLGREAKSLRLYNWFNISFLPFALWVPLDIFATAGLSDTLISLIKFSLFGLILSLQITIIKTQYGLSLKKSILLYVFPFIFTGLSFLVLVFVMLFLR